MKMLKFVQRIGGVVSGSGRAMRLSALAIVNTGKEEPNFSIFEISGSEFVIMIRVKGITVYVGVEGEEELEEEEAAEVLEGLIPALSREIRNFRSNLKGFGLIYDDMGQEMKEFIYDVIMRHSKGKSPYDQVEAA